MSMNLACCFIHAGYEYRSEREREGGRKKRGGEGKKERVQSERLREKQMETRRATGKEKHEETESVIKTTADLFTLCATHSN